MEINQDVGIEYCVLVNLNLFRFSGAFSFEGSWMHQGRISEQLVHRRRSWSDTGAVLGVFRGPIGPVSVLGVFRGRCIGLSIVFVSYVTFENNICNSCFKDALHNDGK